MSVTSPGEYNGARQTVGALRMDHLPPSVVRRVKSDIVNVRSHGVDSAIEADRALLAGIVEKNVHKRGKFDNVGSLPASASGERTY